MAKIKVTLNIERVLLTYAREHNINLSALLEDSLMHTRKLKRVVSIVEEKEYY